MLACTDATALIDGPRVLRFTITDAGEPLADTRSITTLAIDHSRAGVQQHLWEASLARLRATRPGLSSGQLERESTRFTAPPGIAPPHSTGGAVDIDLLCHDGAVDMGWGFGQPGEGSRPAAPLTAAARRHRGLLGDVMTAAGLINYPAEWWHWSYGDRYRAFQTGHATTRYGPL
ncbi:MAG: M15 family metallopeptidase [Streptosporangiaceae bacterium]